MTKEELEYYKQLGFTNLWDIKNYINSWDF